MPYTVSNAPTGKLPKAGVKLWVSIFNSTLAETKDENKARIAAWSAVKAKWRKVGDTWERKSYG